MVANSPTALANSVLGLEARNRDPSSREPERNAVEIDRRSIEMYLLTLRTIHSDAGISTHVLVNIANLFAEEKRILFIDVRKNVNEPWRIFLHPWEGAEPITTK